VKITDGNESNFLNCDKGMRAKLFGHLLNAKKTLAPAHPAHGSINKAANLMGGIVDDRSDEISVKDRSEDDSDDPANLTSPGQIDMNVNAREAGARQAPGASDIATRSLTPQLRKDAKGVWEVYSVKKADTTSNTRRDLLVRILYKSAAAMKAGPARTALEKFTLRFDSLSKRDLDSLTERDWASVEKLAMGSTPDTGVPFIGGFGNRTDWWDRHFSA
jgi:hypothetical protein